MRKAIALLYLEGANVRIPFEVEFHGSYDKGDPDDAYRIDDVVQQMFPHLKGYSVFGEFVEDNDDGD